MSFLLHALLSAAVIANSVRELKTTCGGIVKAFFSNLLPDEKELFKATTLAEQILEEVQAADNVHKDKSRSRKAAQALKPLLAGINRYGAALDVISNSSSMILCPLWGGTRIVLMVETILASLFLVFAD